MLNYQRVSETKSYHPIFARHHCDMVIFIMVHQSQNELLPENLRDFVLGQLEVPKLCLLLRIQRYQTKEH